MNTQLRNLTVLALVTVVLLSLGAPTQAQPPIDTADLDGFLSLARVTGQPTLIVKPESRDIALAQMGAHPLSENQFYVDILDRRIIFGVWETMSPAFSLPVVGEDDEDIITVLYNHRSCERQKFGTLALCRKQTDGRYMLSNDGPVNRCSKFGTGKCTEFRVVSSHTHYFYDPGCTLEIPGTYEQKTGLRCAL